MITQEETMILTLFQLWVLIAFCCAAGWMMRVGMIISDQKDNTISNMKAKYEIKKANKWSLIFAIFPVAIPAYLLYGIYRTYRWYRDGIKTIKVAPWAQQSGDKP
jgi:hypothetical protein